MSDETVDDRRPGDGVQAPNELAVYAELSRIGTSQQLVGEKLERVAELAKRVLPETPEVSVTLLRGDEGRTAVFTGDLALHLDELQYDQGFGPCLDAAANWQTVKVTMDDPDGLYPEFCRIAQDQGVSHSMSLPLPMTAGIAGALNLYNSTGQPFRDEDESVASTFATFAGIVLTNPDLHHDAASHAAQLVTALTSRATIEQAKGILMARRGCSAEEAFRMLSALAQRQDVKLRLVAQAMVDQAGRR